LCAELMVGGDSFNDKHRDILECLSGTVARTQRPGQVIRWKALEFTTCRLSK
jgi:hypothetical protein